MDADGNAPAPVPAPRNVHVNVPGHAPAHAHEAFLPLSLFHPFPVLLRGHPALASAAGLYRVIHGITFAYTNRNLRIAGVGIWYGACTGR